MPAPTDPAHGAPLSVKLANDLLANRAVAAENDVREVLGHGPTLAHKARGAAMATRDRAAFGSWLRLSLRSLLR